jgi:hypothetical protein
VERASKRGGFRGRAQRVDRARLALREIDGNLAFTDREVWAWYWLPTQPWAFRSDTQREQLVYGLGEALAWLAGHRLHLRVTTRPYPADEWARQLNRLSPAARTAETDASRGAWERHLVAMQRHLRHQTMADKEVFLGVRLASRPLTGRVAAAVLRRPGSREWNRLAGLVDRVSDAVGLPGMDGYPATPSQLEWLLRRSVGLGLPSPRLLSPHEQPRWESEDLHSFTDAVDHAAVPLGRTVRVYGHHDQVLTAGPGAGPGAGAGMGGAVVERHVAVLSVGRLEEIDVPDPGQDPWLAHTDRLPFGVEWSAHLDVLSGGQARQAIQRKLLVVRDMQRHYAEHDLDEPLALDRQARHARTVEDQMSRGADVAAARAHGWFRLAVSGATEGECLERVRRVVASYRGRRVAIEHPRGQYGLLREFIPGEPVSTTAYRRRLPVLYVAAGVPTAASQVGDRRGPYLGYTAGSSRRAVMFDTHYATEVRETSGLVPVVGGLGAGKSVLLGAVAHAAVLRGIPTVIMDPSGPLARLTELPELAGRARHVDLTNATPGTLNPFDVVPEPTTAAYPDPDQLEEAKVLAAQDRKLLAMDVIKMLLPPAVAGMPATSLVVSDAVRQTKGARMTSLWRVVELLDAAEDPHGQVVANYLRDMAELPLARLFFSNPIYIGQRLDADLTVLTMPGLVLPPTGVPRENWSTSEQLAVPLLHLCAWFATRAVYGRPRADRKLIALDETHFLGQWSAGRALFTRLGRDSRKWNTAVLAASQNPADVLGMDVANFISAAFVGRTEDDDAARDALRMLRVPTGAGYERALATLSPTRSRGGVPTMGQPTGGPAPGPADGTAAGGSLQGRPRPGFREFVMRDVDGNVDKIRIDLSPQPALLEALDTTPSAPSSPDSPDGRDGAASRDDGEHHVEQLQIETSRLADDEGSGEAVA